MALPPGFSELSGTSATPAASKLPAGFQEVGTDEPDWGNVVKSALNEARMGNGSKMRDLMTDPITQAKALPYLQGAAFSVMGVPMGMTAGTVGGRQLSNAALRAYGHPEEIPSGTSQVAEGLLSAAGDATAIPALNRKDFGSQIGTAEKLAGVPPPQDIPQIAMPTGTKSIGEFINGAVDSVKSAGGEGSPTYWKQIKDQVDRIYKLGKDQPLTSLDKGRLKWLNEQVQTGLNTAVPGRAEPAAALARSQTVPNAISSVARNIPWWAKAGITTGATVAGLDPLAKSLLGFGHGRQ